VTSAVKASDQQRMEGKTMNATTDTYDRLALALHNIERAVQTAYAAEPEDESAWPAELRACDFLLGIIQDEAKAAGEAGKELLALAPAAEALPVPRQKG
jgi:hypothetical protein